MAMNFKSKIWQPIAIVVSAANLVSVGFAAAAAQSWHAGVHAGLALVFGLWAQRLRQKESEPTPALAAGGSELQAGLEALEIEVSDLRRDLNEAQERLDFTERMLTKGREVR
jgi:hypothetical protein